MPIVGNQTWPSPLDLIERQADGFRIEFRVIQERQLAKPPELAITTGETARKPIWDLDANEPLSPASIENDCVK